MALHSIQNISIVHINWKMNEILWLAIDFQLIFFYCFAEHESKSDRNREMYEVCVCELLDGLLLFFSSIVGFFQQIINLLTVMLRRITATAQNQLNQRTIYYNLNHDMCMECAEVQINEEE